MPRQSPPDREQAFRQRLFDLIQLDVQVKAQVQDEPFMAVEGTHLAELDLPFVRHGTVLSGTLTGRIATRVVVIRQGAPDSRVPARDGAPILPYNSDHRCSLLNTGPLTGLSGRWSPGGNAAAPTRADSS